MAALENYVVRILAELDYERCGQQLATYVSPEFGNDLFSLHRKKLETQAGLFCADYRTVLGHQRYAELAQRFNRELAGRYGIEFTRLIAITNMPISRFLDDLLTAGEYENYMRTLVDAFNPATVNGVMCRTTLSVDWQGRLFDCDFNQMLDLEVACGLPRHIRDFDFDQLATRRIVTGRHCFGCTAGAGSSCQGSISSTATMS